MLSSHQTLLLRADASPATGLRYVQRCVQLAQAWQQLGGKATIACGDLPYRLAARLATQQIRVCELAHADCSVADANETLELARRLNPTWLVVDGPAFNFAFRERLAEGPCKLVTFDAARDRGAASEVADLVVLDECTSAQPRASTQRLPSSTAAVRRQPIALVGNRYRIAPENSRLGVSAPSVARRLLVWLSPTARPETIRDVVVQLDTVCVPRSSIEVVVSAHHRDAAPVLEIKRMQGNATVQLIHSVERRFASTLSVHFAVTDDDTVESSLAGRGIPVVRMAPVQDMADKPFRGFGRRLSQLIRDADRRNALTDTHVAASNHHAARRIARRLASAEFRLIPAEAEAEDWSDVWKWTCHSESKAVSLSIVGGDDASVRNAPRSQQAYVDALADPTCQHWIARRSNGKAVAFASLNSSASDGTALVQLIVNPSLRNQGVGTALLERVVERVFSDSTTNATTAGPLHALIMQTSPRNHAAQQMAVNAGFTQIAPAIVDGTVAHQFAITRRSATGHSVLAPEMRRRSA